jgi:hypothetical protein
MSIALPTEADLPPQHGFRCRAQPNLLGAQDVNGIGSDTADDRRDGR